MVRWSKLLEIFVIYPTKFDQAKIFWRDLIRLPAVNIAKIKTL